MVKILINKGGGVQTNRQDSFFLKKREVKFVSPSWLNFRSVV